MAQTLDTFHSAATAQGLGWDSSSRWVTVYPVVADRNRPPAFTNAAGFRTLVEGWLRARGFLYWKVNYGDCPAPSAIPGVNVAGLATNVGANAAGLGLQLAGVAGAGLAGVTLGISALVSTISAVFQHHQQAIIDEQTTLCAVSAYFNKGIALIDNAVLQGQIDAADGVAAMKSLVTQTAQGMAGIEKSCNAACIYTGAVKAHADFAAQYYPAISPVSIPSLAPGGAPTGFGSLPGGVPVQANQVPPPPPIRSVSPPASVINVVPLVSAADRTVTGQVQQSSGITGKIPDVAPTAPTNWNMVLVVAVGILVLFLAFAK